MRLAQIDKSLDNYQRAIRIYAETIRSIQEETLCRPQTSDPRLEPIREHLRTINAAQCALLAERTQLIRQSANAGDCR